MINEGSRCRRDISSRSSTLEFWRCGPWLVVSACVPLSLLRLPPFRRHFHGVDLTQSLFTMSMIIIGRSNTVGTSKASESRLWIDVTKIESKALGNNCIDPLLDKTILLSYGML